MPRQRLEDLRRLWQLRPLTEPTSGAQEERRVKTVVANDSIKSVMKYLSALSVFCCAKGDMNEVTIKEPIQVDSSAGIYMIILVIGVIAVAMWEIAKAALRKVNPAARLRRLAAGSWATPSSLSFPHSGRVVRHILW